MLQLSLVPVSHTRARLTDQPLSEALGGVMRARKGVYPSSVAFRANANGCPVHEPAGIGQVETSAAR